MILYDLIVLKFNQVCKETNVIYHDYTAKNGISDTFYQRRTTASGKDY